jgi:hypothetical protein
MPTARVIARDAARAEKTVNSLQASGYEVEVVAPDAPQTGPCDLLIDLEQVADPEMTAYSLEDAAAFFVDSDPPAKREFVFAPLWRTLRGFARDRVTAWQSQTATQEVQAAEHPPLVAAPPAASPEPDLERIAAEFAQERTRLQAEFAAQLEQVKHERRTQGEQILRLQRELAAMRREYNFLRQSQSVQAPLPEVVPTATPAPRASRMPEIQARLEQYAQQTRRWVATGSQRAGRTSVVAASWMRDRMVRPSFSIAAGIVFAFLLGFWAATGKPHPEQPVAPAVQANVSSATVVPASARSEKNPVPKKASTTKARKPSPVKREKVVAKDEEPFEEVVVRHYPSRGAVAKTESPNKVKQYSDIEDEQ